MRGSRRGGLMERLGVGVRPLAKVWPSTTNPQLPTAQVFMYLAELNNRKVTADAIEQAEAMHQVRGWVGNIGGAGHGRPGGRSP